MEKNVEATLQAIERKGALSHTVVHGVFVGPARSGKNSLMENLLGQCPPLDSPSTGVAEAVIQVQVEKLTTVAAMVDTGPIWSRIDYNDEIIRLISIHSDSKNVQYEHQANLINLPSAASSHHPNVVKDNTPHKILTKLLKVKALMAFKSTLRHHGHST